MTTTQALAAVPDSAPANHPYDPMAMLNQFHSAFGIKQFIDLDSYGRDKLAKVRLAIIAEEFKEVTDEMLDLINGEGDRAKLAKEIADLIYVLYGTAAVLDIPMYPVFAEVHHSNMSKLGDDGKPVLRADGKVLKGPNYAPADIEAVLGTDSV